jgi:hypothetical protein
MDADKLKNAPHITPSVELVEKLVKLLESAHSDAGVVRGACVYNTPIGPKCAQLTPQECAALGGTYVGGSCH